MNYESIKLTTDGEYVARLTLARPDSQNAMSMRLVQELRHALRVIAADDKLRAVVLTGEGKSFCAGGDLNWMQSVLKQSRSERIAESMVLAELFYELDNLPKVVVGRIKRRGYWCRLWHDLYL